MKKTIGLLLAFAVLFGISCSDDSSSDLPSERTFWAIDFKYNDYLTNPDAWYQIETELLVKSTYSAVYVDKNVSVTRSQAEALASEFDSRIYPRVTQNFASHYDVDGNGKVILLVHDIKDNFSLNGSYLGGYFFTADYYTQASVSAQYPAAKSNEGDILYIDCNPQDFNDEEAHRTAAHEFQHMVNFSYNVLKEEDFLDTWIDEGLAEAANHLVYGEVTPRISYYNTDSDNDFKNGHPLFYWDNDNVLPNYSLSYLFFQYLRSQSSSGNAIFKKIIQSSHGDDGAVIDAVGGDSNLLAHGSNKEDAFNKLLLRWYATNAGVTGSGYGYDSEISTSITPHLYGSMSVTLRSGGGVAKGINSSKTVSATDYIYMSVNNDGTAEDFSNSYDALDKFIAVYRNYNTGTHDGIETSLPFGNVVAEEEPAFTASRSVSSDSDPKPQKIDFIAPKGFTESLGPIKGEDE